MVTLLMVTIWYHQVTMVTLLMVTTLYHQFTMVTLLMVTTWYHQVYFGNSTHGNYAQFDTPPFL